MCVFVHVQITSSTSAVTSDPLASSSPVSAHAQFQTVPSADAWALPPPHPLPPNTHTLKLPLPDALDSSAYAKFPLASAATSRLAAAELEIEREGVQRWGQRESEVGFHVKGDPSQSERHMGNGEERLSVGLMGTFNKKRQSLVNELVLRYLPPASLATPGASALLLQPPVVCV